jgi:hypothetical protein
MPSRRCWRKWVFSCSPALRQVKNGLNMQPYGIDYEAGLGMVLPEHTFSSERSWQLGRVLDLEKG